MTVNWICIIFYRFMNEEKVILDHNSQESQTVTEWVVRRGRWIATTTAVQAAKESGLPWDVIVLGSVFAGYVWFRLRG